MLGYFSYRRALPDKADYTTLCHFMAQAGRRYTFCIEKGRKPPQNSPAWGIRSRSISRMPSVASAINSVAMAMACP